MAIAETAQLLVDLRMQEQISGASQKAISSVKNLETAAVSGGGRISAGMARVGAGFRAVESAAGRAAGAISHAGGQIKNLVTGPLGMIGLGAGLLGLGAALSSSISKAEEFGRAGEDLAKVTGLNIEKASAMVDVLDKFGITADRQIRTVGMLEKNLGNIGVKAKGAAEFTATYGLAIKNTSITAKQLTDALQTMSDKAASKDQKLAASTLLQKYNNATMKDANGILLEAADYFNNKAIPAQTKAAALAKLFGKSWADLIPILSQGSAGIRAETESAIHLTDAQLANLAKFRVAQRDWADSLGDLQTLIGVDVMPTLTDGLRGLTAYLEAHRDDIREFFQRGLEVAKRVVGTITGTVIPTLMGLGGAVKAAWDTIPPPLRDILLKGFIADRTIKFLFGVSPIHMVVEGIEGALARGLGSAFGGTILSKAFVQPVFVTNPGFGLGGGIGGAAGAAEGAAGGGLSGLVAGALKLAIPVLGGLAIAAAWKTIVQDPALKQQGNQVQNSATSMIANGASTKDLITALDGAKEGVRQLTNAGFAQPLIDALYGGQIDAARATAAAIQAELDRRARVGPVQNGPMADPRGLPPRGGAAPRMEATRGSRMDALSRAEVTAGVNASRVAHKTDIESLRGVIKPAVQTGVKQGIGPDIESMRGRIAAGIAGTTAAVKAKRLSATVKSTVNVSTSTKVSISARDATSAVSKYKSWQSSMSMNRSSLDGGII